MDILQERGLIKTDGLVCLVCREQNGASPIDAGCSVCSEHRTSGALWCCGAQQPWYHQTVSAWKCDFHKSNDDIKVLTFSNHLSQIWTDLYSAQAKIPGSEIATSHLCLWFCSLIVIPGRAEKMDCCWNHQNQPQPLMHRSCRWFCKTIFFCGMCWKRSDILNPQWIRKRNPYERYNVMWWLNCRGFVFGEAVFGGSIGPEGELWTTYSRIGQFELGIIFCAEINTTFQLKPRHTGLNKQVNLEKKNPDLKSVHQLETSIGSRSDFERTFSLESSSDFFNLQRKWYWPTRLSRPKRPFSRPFLTFGQKKPDPVVESWLQFSL